MLVDITIKNFGAIAEETTISMETSSTRTKHEDYVINTNFKQAANLVTSLGIFGPNDSGKTTVFQAIKYINTLILCSDFKEPITLPNRAFKLSELKDEDSSISINFIHNDVMYNYALSFNPNKITKEVLTAKGSKKNSKWKTLIDREKHIPKLAEKYIKKHKDLDKDLVTSTIDNKLLLVLKARNSKNVHLKEVLDFFNSYKCFDDSFLVEDSFIDIEESKDKIINIMNRLDNPIYDIKFDVYDDDVKLPEDMIEYTDSIIRKAPHKTHYFKRSDGTFTRIKDGKTESLQIIVVPYKDKDYTYPLQYASPGLSKIFSYVAVMVEVLRSGSILFIDNINNSIHPYVTTYLIDMFNNKDINKTQAQLVFIATDVVLLDKRCLTADQIYLTEKDKETLETTIVPLCQFRGINKGDNERNMRKYLEGAFGAVPDLL